jgi:uncharacterized membrane protein YkvA (DUF1232 family)
MHLLQILQIMYNKFVAKKYSEITPLFSRVLTVYYNYLSVKFQIHAALVGEYSLLYAASPINIVFWRSNNDTRF